MTPKKHLFLLLPLTFGACLTDIEGPELGTDSAEISGDTAASAYFRDRAVVFLGANGDPFCTGTRVGPNWVLTAMHCGVAEGNVVAFYTSSSAYDRYRVAEVAEVFEQAGTHPSTCQSPTSGACLADDDGDFADVALVRLRDDRHDRDAEGPQAIMAWRFPTNQPAGTKVGGGDHNGDLNANGRLQQHTDYIDSPNDGDGKFVTDDDDTDSSDSGGPFYVQNPTGVHKVVGVLWGSWYEPVNHYNVYTSVPEHLAWLLATMDYRWRGLPVQTGKRYAGTTLDSFIVEAERVCQYACEQTEGCEAYNYDPRPEQFGALQNMCELKSAVTGMSSSSAWRGALRHGARSGVSNDVVGYRRSDGYNAVVHRSSTAKVHELWEDAPTEWRWGVINSGAPAVASDLSAYVRADGLNVVVYRSTDNRIIQVYLDDDGWDWNVLPEVEGSTPAGDPVAYVRHDGVDAVVYRTTLGRIYELSRGLGGWTARNLSASANNFTVAESDPSVIARPDGYSAVVFTSGGHVYELWRGWSGSWTMSAPSALVDNPIPAPAAASRPYAYTHSNGVHAIVYRSTGDRLIELWLFNDTWFWGELSGAAIKGDPTAYIRTDALEAVLVRSTSNHVLEIANAPWATYNLSADTGQTGVAGTDPVPLIRFDGFNTVLFEVSGNHIREMNWRPGTLWHWRDLSSLAGEMP